MHIHLTVPRKFGVALLFGSGVIICQRQNSETAIIRQLHALSDATPRCFLWTSFRRDFCNVVEPQDPSAARLIFGVVAASGSEGCHWNVDQVSPSLIGQWISPCFSMDVANTALGPRCGHHWNVQLLSNTTVQVQCSYVVLFSRWSCSSPFSSSLSNMLMDQVIKTKTAPSRELYDEWTPDLYHCVAEKLHIPMMSASWPQSGVGDVHTTPLIKEDHSQCGAKLVHDVAEIEKNGERVCLMCFRVLSFTDYNSRVKQESNTKLARHSEWMCTIEKGHAHFRNCTTSALASPNMDGVR